MCLNFFVGHISKRDCREGKRTTVDYIVYIFADSSFQLVVDINKYFLGWPIFSAHSLLEKSFYFSISFNIVQVQDNFKRLIFH